ncbi:GGDEF domain-containing protein [Marinobacter vulgaris]|uniref:GGDEF domain-containing protein n=1 Tax=Marinobacter vulgaris TaxID=1928331 RepID=A0A2V3ZLL5_9GAMM|nr:GGDEF and EAL domain-containing protein [Marinobacter vulgaris]PXX91798.1 GGDEF domain-containing protein [Marinobacter vulgaris]TSJ70694.1 GGDEF and EAL domain-containing protein [Marinobacter vulgaris]
MRLSEFIRTHMEDILRIWEYDADKILPIPHLSREELRDHIKEILLGIAVKLEQPPIGHDRFAEFCPQHPDSGNSARIHGSERHDLGADIVHVAAEFRALRVTVIELWVQFGGCTGKEDAKELIRFDNEIDMALAQSIGNYALKKQKQGRLFETMLSSLPDPCYILNLDGTFLYANNAMAGLCQVKAEDIIGRAFSEMPLHSRYNGEVKLQDVIRFKEQREGEVRIEGPSGDIHYYEYLYAPVIDDKGEVEAVSGIAHDITLRKESEARIWCHANFDLLTKLPNRRLFMDRLSQHAAHSDRTGDPFALLFIDLDHFKGINDRFGHDAGDNLLKKIAERVSACVRQTDTVARIGGDEFTVLLLDTGDREFIEGIAGNILAALERPFQLDENEASLSGSIGITLFPEDAGTAQQLLNDADQAMYLAKHSGRNRLCYFTDIMKSARSQRQQLINDLREAPLGKQLRLFYQPIIDLSNGRIVKAEALLRWQHPEQGLKLPDEFLGVAEESGLMSSLEHWVFSEAAAQAVNWSEFMDSSFQVTINSSPLQFTQNIHSKPWEAHLEKFLHSNTSIVIELTENVFLGDSEQLERNFTELRDAGVQLALDDFGTGYSSLAYLKRFDVNYLKIDQSFVRENEPGSSSHAIAETIIMMAHKLGLQVVAEGVETAEQRDWLKAAGCDFAQGFFFSKPVPAAELEPVLRIGYTHH